MIYFFVELHMENQINAGDQNTQQIGQNNAESSAKDATNPKINLWMYISLVLLLLLILSIVGFSFILKSQKSTPRITPPPTNTISPTPTTTANTQKNNTEAPTETETAGVSYGLFYPYSDGVTINNSRPTVVGKTGQSGQSYLSTKFGIEKSPVSGEDDYFLRFIPGRVKNLEIKIDNSIIQDVYGVPQYPTVLCKRINLNPDGTSTYDPQTGKKSPPDNIFTTENECFAQMSANIPPLIFFVKPNSNLSEGSHTLTITSNNIGLKSMKFVIAKTNSIGKQIVPKTDLILVPGYDYLSKQPITFDSSDNCGEGYYYDVNFLKIPLPIFENRNLFYGISFPQSKEEQGSIKRRRVQIGFDGKRFDLFFPQSSIFYDGKSFRNNTIIPEKALFLPKDHLFFTDGKKASITDAYSIIPQNSNYDVGYFEIYPVDISGMEYRGSSLPWVISGSSGCDG